MWKPIVGIVMERGKDLPPALREHAVPQYEAGLDFLLLPSRLSRKGLVRYNFDISVLGSMPLKTGGRSTALLQDLG